jgi:LPS export ABC transporter permease LptG
MKILTRYVLREYLVPLTYCLAAFCLLYLVYDLFERFSDFLEAHTTLPQVLLFYAHYLFAVNGFVPFIVVIMPIALLLSQLYTLVALALHNELTAMRANGFSLYRLLLPFMIVALTMGVLGAIIQETIGPYATRWITTFNTTVIAKTPQEKNVVRDYLYHTGETYRHWMIQRFDLTRPGVLENVKIIQDRKDGSLAEEYFAAKAEWLDESWWLYALQVKKYDLRGEPIGGLSEPAQHPVEMRAFRESPEDFLQEMSKTDFLSSWDMYRYLRTHPKLSPSSRARRSVDLQARLAMPWTCLVVVLMGMPAAMTSSRKGALLSVLLAIAFLFGFYFLLHTGMILGKRLVIAPWLAGWLPNVLFAAAGLWALSRLRN